MVQKRKMSVVETVVNVGSGYFVAMAMNLFILPHFIEGIVEQSITTASIVGVIYTSVSMVRSYIFRRSFEKIGRGGI